MLSLAITSSDDPTWLYFLKAMNKEEKKRLILFPIDKLNASFVEYDPINEKVKFKLQNGKILTESDISSIWFRRLPVSEKLAKNKEDAKYCKEEYQKFFENLEFVLPNVRWVSKPSAIRKAKNKAYQLNIAKKIGFNLPETIFTNYSDSLEKMFYQLPEGIVYKSVNTPNIREQKKHLTVWTTKIQRQDLKLGKGLSLCPGILQQFIDKKSDIRVTVFGEKVFAVEIQSQVNEISKIDFRLGGDESPHLVHELPENMENRCRKLVKELGLEFGAIDLALQKDGSYIFFEINANGQWGWLEEHTGLPMRRALLDLLFGYAN